MPMISKKARANDTHDIERRLETLIHLHLLDIEENPEMYDPKMRLSTIQYVGMYLNRKYGWGDPEVEGVGSAVRKYSGAFRTTPHVAGAGGAKAGSHRAGARASSAYADDEESAD